MWLLTNHKNFNNKTYKYFIIQSFLPIYYYFLIIFIVIIIIKFYNILFFKQTFFNSKIL